MLDWRRVVQDRQGFVQALLNRGMSAGQANEVASTLEAISKERVESQKQSDALKAERNKTSGQVAQLMKSGQKEEAQRIIEQGKQIGAELEKLDRVAQDAEAKFSEALAVIPNMPHESVPVGLSAADNKVVREWGTTPTFDFKPRSHDEIGQLTGLIDFERAGKISGARFTFLRDGLARLERALISLMFDLHRPHGYEEIETPYLVSARTMYGIGQFPKFVEDVFKIEGQDKYLIPTAEVPVTSLFADEIIADEVLPKKFMAFSPCFRSEAGSYGKDTKGLIRQHQFHKVEMVKFTRPDESLAELESMVDHAENVLRVLEIPYRTLLLCTGDMGFNSRKTYDIEVWLPGSVFDTSGAHAGDAGAAGSAGRGCYREISSCSDCGDFQSRRSGIRYKPKGGKGTSFVHTLNGSGLAVGRTLVAVMENYQRADGSITVPAALRPYMGGLEVIGPVAGRGPGAQPVGAV